MQMPSAKVIVATIAAVATTAAAVLATDGLPTGPVGWLAFAGKVFGSAAVVGALGYVKTETNPPAELVARIEDAASRRAMAAMARPGEDRGRRQPPGHGGHGAPGRVELLMDESAHHQRR